MSPAMTEGFEGPTSGDSSPNVLSDRSAVCKCKWWSHYSIKIFSGYSLCTFFSAPLKNKS